VAGDQLGRRGCNVTISVTLEGADELAAALKKIGKQSGPATTKIANATAVELQGNIKKRILRGPNTGRTYKRGTISHTASSPGQAPATDTGRLVGSVYFDSARGSFGAAVATVGSKLAYALHLEYGTRNMKPRPVWEPEAKKAQVKFIKRINAYLERATK